MEHRAWLLSTSTRLSGASAFWPSGEVHTANGEGRTRPRTGTFTREVLSHERGMVNPAAHEDVQARHQLYLFDLSWMR